MATFADAPLGEAALALQERLPAQAPGVPTGAELQQANLYAVSELIAARAPRESSRRQYRSIFRRFCDVLRDELGRPPVVADLSADTIAAYARQLEAEGGRAGRPAALSTRRVHITMLRALAAELALHDVAEAVRLPSHRVGPPETLTAVEYANLHRAPDRRSQLGKRDYAVLRVLGDCGLRNAELRGLPARAIRRPRSNSRHHHLYVVGKGGVEREVPIPAETQAALNAWMAVHPLHRGQAGLRDEQPVFVALGRHDHADPRPLSNSALHKLVRRYAKAAGLPVRLSHPHVLRAFYATTLAGDGVPVHVIARRLGHSSIETTNRYLAEIADDITSVGDVLDRRHQSWRRDRLLP
jgi:site-specific recombinase XerD